MKIQSSLLFFPLVCLLSVSASAQSFSNVIYLPNRIGTGEIAESIKDMAYWLGKTSTKPFVIKEGISKTSEGIQLINLEDAQLNPAVKKQLQQDGQSFYLDVKGTQTARIIGTGIHSFNNGIYTFLYLLGFRWYMPGDVWTIVPKLNTSSLKIAQVYKPDFQNRFYFGTGGVNAIPGLDGANTFKKDFDTWNRRNRLSTDFAVKGHTGQAFFKENQKVLAQHPEYFCNNKVNRNGRIDISNQAATDLFVEWALGQLKPEEKFPVIGVDPADGSGGNDDCLPANMPQVKNWSDKYFWLANKVAEKAAVKGLNPVVQLYAYASHAAPPQFELHKNVYPVIIPYAFQDVADPRQYIELWHKKMKGRAMGIYDYWNITQWSHDLPQFNIYTIPTKLKLWKLNNITTINLESTNAKGPMGHAFWLASQMMWDTNQNFEHLYQEFLTQCFGPAAASIKKMYDRWSQNYQGAMDVGLSLKDLEAAAAKTRDTAIQQRIGELKAYVHYLNLYYDYQYQPSVKGYTELIDYIYSTHHLRLLQTHALQALYIKAPVGHQKLVDKSLVAQRNAAIRPLDAAAIERNFKEDLKLNPALYTLTQFAFDIKKATPNLAKEKNEYNPLYINGKISYLFYLPTEQKVKLQAGATKDTRLVIKDSEEKVRLDKLINGAKEGFESIEIELSRGAYNLSFGANARFSRLQLPKNIAFFSYGNHYDNFRYPMLYVYIPKDASEIVYSDQYGPGTNKMGNWIDPEGKHIKPELLRFTIYRVPVPPQHRGKIWTLNMGHRKFELLNIPNLFSLNPFNYSE